MRLFASLRDSFSLLPLPHKALRCEVLFECIRFVLFFFIVIKFQTVVAYTLFYTFFEQAMYRLTFRKIISSHHISNTNEINM